MNYILFPLAFIHSILLGGSIRYSPVWQVIWVLLGLCVLGTVFYILWNRRRVGKNRYKVVKVVQETSNVRSLYFKPRRFEFKPGQFLVLRLAQKEGVSEPHPFTISSSPAAETFSVTIKAVGDFTRKIAGVKEGDHVLVDAPYGKFSFLEFPAEEYVFIAGGIGITPFMSMLRYMRDKGVAKKVLLLWGNRTEQDIAFRGELEELAKALPGLKVVHVMSEADGWNGETGFITAELISKYAGELARKEFFICGPPVMLEMALKELESLGVPKKQIHFEKFSW